MKAIRNVNIVLTDRVILNGTIVFDEKIQEILHSSDLSKYKDIEVIDGMGGYVTPGFIDIHIHGFYGHDTMEGSYEAINTMSKNVVKTGVTSFLPTTMTMEYKIIKRALENVVSIKEEKFDGAKVLGVNLEGPFINPKYKGAQMEEYILEPDIQLIEDYLDIIKIVTVAPEISGAEDFIKKIKEKGIVTSVGHSGATYEEVERAREWGLSHATHLFNAMTGLHHRKPGVVGAVLSTEMTCEIIVDNVHLNPAILKIITRAKDNKDIILITDSMQAGGLSEDVYSLGGQKVIVRNGEARLESGALAGSVLTIDRAIRNMLSATGLPINEVVNMATINPARLLKIDDKIGHLKEGLQSDIVLLNRDFRVEKVYLEGENKLEQTKL
ncbi:N-acetylglucosamine-6-phosphate deacetylase [Wukongibacter baidiensis]|uniref:N-acetylglucosamine-6-phosphate deacetylase n=1 Tax=Wukongibacter baidiensis TaxID=1723361 RepID=UPI003D7FB3C6